MRIGIVLILTGLSFFSVYPVVQAKELLEPDHVLLINSYNQRMSWVKDIVNAVKDVLDPDNNNIVLHIANMDSKQFHTKEYFDSYKNFLKVKYKNSKFSLILSSDNNAFDFLQKNRDELFPNVPVIFCGVNNFKDNQIIKSDKFTGVAEIFSARNTVKIALKLHPKTKKIFIINDYLETGKAWKRDIENALSNMKEKINITYSDNLSMEDLQTTIANLDNNTIVLLGVYFADKDDKYFTYEKVGAMISSASQVPVYCLLEFNMGSGVVGGEVISGYYQGQAMAKIARQILDGKNPNDISVVKKGTNRIIFDYLQLKRFNLTESSLPPDRVVINKPFSVFQQYKKEIFVTLFMVTFLIITIVALILNIYRRIRAEKASKESEERFHYLADAAMEAIFFTKDGICIEANQAGVDMFGYNHSEFIGMFGTDIIVSKSHEIVKEHMLKNLSDPYEAVGKHKDGTHFPIAIQAKTIPYKDKGLVRVTSITDISERKQAEKEIYKFKTISDKANYGSTITDLEGNIEYINDYFAHIHGFSSKRLIGQNLSVFHNEKQIGEVSKIIGSLLKEGSFNTVEIWHTHKDGTPFPMLMNGTILNDENGNPQHMAATAIDISDHKKLETQLQQSQRLESIGTLAGGIAHDFNNILFPILGYTEMLIDDAFEGSSSRKNLDQIYKGALRARDLVKQILTFSCQENSDLRAMKMQPIIMETLKLIRSTIPTTIDIKQDIDVKCGGIKADPTQIHQIIMNLTTNAYHAMEKTGGELKTSLKEIKLGKHDIIHLDMMPGFYACLSVKDTGAGMVNDVKDKIFDPFFTTKEKGKGTGMGLSVVHGIVNSLGGAIQVHSNPGKGTEFKLYIPVEKNSLNKQKTKTQDPIPAGNERILLVDDEKTILNMEKQMLERFGYQITSHTNSIKALETFKVNPDKFDLVVTDMAMPNIPGDRLSAELIRIRPDIPILLCTGFSEAISEEKATALGIQGFLLKPIAMKDLCLKIREVLDKKGQTQ